jgi:DNA-binding response OmpR family regulator
MDAQVILALQDRPTILRLQHLLEDQGYILAGYSSGSEARNYLNRHYVHLLILETHLEDTSGVDLCHRLRQQGYHQPILMLTDRDGETDKVLALEMGADDYVTKPFNCREVLSRIRALLRRAYGEFANRSGEQISIADLVIDRLRGQAWNAGKPLPLTPIEFRLLVYLARHANQALTRAQIIDAVWGYEIDVNSERVVNTHICRLREKLEQDALHALAIETVSGIGYCLETDLQVWIGK